MAENEMHTEHHAKRLRVCKILKRNLSQLLICVITFKETLTKLYSLLYFKVMR